MGYRDDCRKTNIALQTVVDAIRTAQTAQEDIAIEFSTTKVLVRVLRTNIRILKAPKIVAVLSEYKKSREELAVALSKLILLTEAAEKTRSEISRLMPRYEALMDEYRQLKLVTGTVLVGNFKGKNGQE